MSNIANIDFTDCIRDAKKGDSQAFTFLYNQTNGYFRSIIIKYAGSDAETEDVLQEVYLKIFRDLDTLKDPRTFLKWGAMISRNLAINELEKRSAKKRSSMNYYPALADSDEEFGMDDFSAVDYDSQINPEAHIDQMETQRLMRAILDDLPAKQRTCILLWQEQFSTREIAETLGIPEGSVKSNINYAKKKIKAKVLELEKQGTRLYGMAPVPFLFWLLKNFGTELQASSTQNAATLHNVMSRAVGEVQAQTTTYAATRTASQSQAAANTAGGGSMPGVSPQPVSSTGTSMGTPSAGGISHASSTAGTAQGASAGGAPGHVSVAEGGSAGGQASASAGAGKAVGAAAGKSASAASVKAGVAKTILVVAIGAAGGGAIGGITAQVQNVQEEKQEEMADTSGDSTDSTEEAVDEEILALQVRYQAYADKIEELETTYGEAKTQRTSAYFCVTGLSFAQLIDFDGDGIEELVTAYSYTNEGYENRAEALAYPVIQVWSYEEDGLVSVFEGETYGTHEANFSPIHISHVGDRYYIIQGYNDVFSIEDEIWGYQDGEFKKITTVSYEEDVNVSENKYYYIDGEEVSSTEYMEAYNTYWEDCSSYYFSGSSYESEDVEADQPVTDILEETVETINEVLGVTGGNET